MVVIKDSNGQKLTLGIELHAGGEGRVLTVNQAPDLVAKIYHRPKAQREKLEAMLQNPPEDNATPGHVSIVWPVDLLYRAESGRTFVGYVMKRIDSAKPFHEFTRISTRQKNHPGFNFNYLHTAARNLAIVFAALHRGGYVVGDVNESNILMNDEALVTIVDTDSFQVPARNKKGFYRCSVGRIEFTPPELQSVDFSKIDRKEYHDLFGLAVLIFQLLMLGYHPFEGSPAPGLSVDDWSFGKRIAEGNFPFGLRKTPFGLGRGSPKLDILHPDLQKLFLRCFEEGQKDPLIRPTAIEWKQALNNAIKQLVICQKVPLHCYGDHLKTCPWCERAKNKSTPDPFPLPVGFGLQTRLPSNSDFLKRMLIEQNRQREMILLRLRDQKMQERQTSATQRQTEFIKQEGKKKDIEKAIKEKMANKNSGFFATAWRTLGQAVTCKTGSHKGEWFYDARDSCEQSMTCERCGEVAKKVEHSWQEWQRIVDTKCEFIRFCSRCALEEINFQHNWDWKYVQTNNCIMQAECKQCHEVNPKRKTVHEQEEWTYLSLRSCEQRLKCTRCQELSSASSRVEHVWGQWSGNGFDNASVRTCKRCGEKQASDPIMQKSINLTGIWVGSDGVPHNISQSGNKLAIQCMNQVGMIFLDGRGQLNGDRVHFDFVYNDGLLTNHGGADMELSPNGLAMQGYVNSSSRGRVFYTLYKQY
jgi:serine/threonine protein kinase